MAHFGRFSIEIMLIIWITTHNERNARLGQYFDFL
ncbi:hypothetical protein LTSERUB_2338, partial [Salmonella enterica subsp. enterica serovar Rubislaw str. A4-653]